MKTTSEIPLIRSADAILEALHKHPGEWVSETTLFKELDTHYGSFYQKAALEHLALNRRIFMRAVSTPSDYHYEYKAR